MLEEAFDVLFTFYRNLQFQQNFLKYPIAVIVLNAQDNTYIRLKELVPEIKEVLSKDPSTGPTEIKARA